MTRLRELLANRQLVISVLALLVLVGGAGAVGAVVRAQKDATPIASTSSTPGLAAAGSSARTSGPNRVSNNPYPYGYGNPYYPYGNAYPYANPNPLPAPNYPYYGPVYNAYPYVYQCVASWCPYRAPAVQLSCSIAISAGPGAGGFLHLADGTYSPDPASNVTLPTPSPAPTPGQRGGPPVWLGATYDRAFSKWLPVPRQNVSPDGATYLFGDAAGNLQLVDVAGGKVRQLTTGQPWSLLDVEPEGAYANKTGATPQPGLYLVPLDGSAIKTVTPTGYWQAVGYGAAYGYDAPNYPQNVPVTLKRYDLKTGATRDEFLGSNNPMPTVIGFDYHGHALIGVGGQQPVLYLATQPKPQSPIVYGSWIQSALADANGVWLQAPDGIYLLQGDGSQGAVRMSTTSAQLASGCA